MFSHISGRILVGAPVIPAVAEAQNSSTGSQVTPPAELIEMVQYASSREWSRPALTSRISRAMGCVKKNSRFLLSTLLVNYYTLPGGRNFGPVQLSPGQCYIISHRYKTFTVHPFLGRFLWILLNHREKYTYYKILCLVSWINLSTSFYLGCKYIKSAILRSMNSLQLYTLREQLNKEGKNELKVCINIPCLDHIGIGA